ncbi:hypothetical protein C4J81_10775 [Deltaproteobacteria bacterium Smac51]|nr:hypothetical protein C4J81_10775 [Deltaproteobacteria bacterium Smac51]
MIDPKRKLSGKEIFALIIGLLILIFVRDFFKSDSSSQKSDDLTLSFISTLKKPSALLNGLNGEEFLKEMEKDHGRENIQLLFRGLSLSEISDSDLDKAVRSLTNEMVDDCMSLIAAMEQARQFRPSDNGDLKMQMAIGLNALATGYNLGEPTIVAEINKRYGQGPKNKMALFKAVTDKYLQINHKEQ